MAEIKLNTALMTDKEVEEQLYKHGDTAVYAVRSTKSHQPYILKHISVPGSQKQVEALIFSGAAADADAAQEYYQQVVSDYREELELLEALSDSPNLSCFHSYEVKPKTDGVGFDVFLLAEMRMTLEEYLFQAELTHASAVNLAIDLCSALIDLRNAGLIHRAVKPSNIFLGSQGHFMLGDLGIAKIDQLKYCSMPEGMLSPYSAPELFELMANVNETVDIYGVGLILYRIYNGNHAPFEDEKTSAKGADKLRITGQELPAPMFADYEMAEILCKACAFKPEERYQSPEELKEALVDYMKRNQAGDSPVIPPIVNDEETTLEEDAVEEEIEPVQFANAEKMDEAFKESFAPDNEMLNELIEAVHRSGDDEEEPLEESENETDGSQTHPVRKNKALAKWLPTVSVILAALAILAVIIWFFFIRVDTLHIKGIHISAQTVDTIEITVDTEEPTGSFAVVCADEYGTSQRKTYNGQPVLFENLASGAQYTVSIEGFERENIAGVPSIYASTVATTNIISLTTSNVRVDSAELTFVTDGAEPEQWRISYGPTGKEPVMKDFSGHTVLLNSLLPDTEYTAVLEDLSTIQLSGNKTIIFRTLPSVTITGDVDIVLSDGVATLNWQYEGQAPESWTVRCTGTQGYDQTNTVTESSCVFENLVGGESYTITISSANMLTTASCKPFVPSALNITEVSAVPGENGTAEITWVNEAASTQSSWLVKYSPANTEGMQRATQTDTNSITLTELIPGVSYDIEICTETGDPVDGGKKLLVMPDAERFNSYGFTSAYVGIFQCPETENWTRNHLTYSKNTFTPDESIAFACESISLDLKDSEDIVTTMIVVRDSNSTLVDYYTGEEVWSNMWSKHGGKYFYVGELKNTPQEPGTYSFEIYFNGKVVNSGAANSFTIK